MKAYHPTTARALARGLSSLLVCAAALAAGCNAESPASPVNAEDAGDRAASASSGDRPTVSSAANTETRLESSESSLEELTSRVLGALRASDVRALTALRITEGEYRELLWPRLPQSAPGRNKPVELHWMLLDTKSVSGAREAVQEYGGLELELLEITPPTGVENLGTFDILRGIELRVRGRSGKEGHLEFLGSIVRMNGGHKLLSYRD